MENIMHIKKSQTKILSLDAFLKKKSGVCSGEGKGCFVRLIGTNAALASDIRCMDADMALRMSNERDFLYHRITRLPVLRSSGDIAYYGGLYESWIAGQRESVSSKAVGRHPVYCRLLGGALKRVSELYAANRPQISGSIERNLIAKMLFWHDSLLCDLQNGWSERLTAKLVLSDLVMEQEYLFAYLLTLLGYDVLLLQSRADISEKLNALSLSQKIVLGAFGDPGLPVFDRQKLMPSAERYHAVRGDDASARASGSVVVRIPPRPGKKSKEPSGNRDFSGQERKAAETASRPVIVKIPPHPGRVSKPPDVAQAQTAVHSATPAQTGGPASHTSAVTQAQAAARADPVQAGRPANAEKPPASAPAVEKSFEELARLASSVVMIAIHGANGDIIGTGSGIMIGRDGYILTNNHVASGGRYYSVRMEDDETVYTTDELIKYHSTLDLAILRIDRKLTPLSIYKGKAPLVRGQKVVAIGSPLGLFNSVSDGIISGFRKIDGVDMIQFTAPTSHGSSGGAVLNLYGEVIGMSTAGFDGGQNINLAMGYDCISRFISGFV